MNEPISGPDADAVADRPTHPFIAPDRKFLEESSVWAIGAPVDGTLVIGPGRYETRETAEKCANGMTERYFRALQFQVVRIAK